MSRDYDPLYEDRPNEYEIDDLENFRYMCCNSDYEELRALKDEVREKIGDIIFHLDANGCRKLLSKCQAYFDEVNAEAAFKLAQRVQEKINSYGYDVETLEKIEELLDAD